MSSFGIGSKGMCISFGVFNDVHMKKKKKKKKKPSENGFSFYEIFRFPREMSLFLFAFFASTGMAWVTPPEVTATETPIDCSA